MFKQLSVLGAAAAMSAATLIPTAPAQAQYYGGYDQRYERGYDRYDRGYDRRYDRRYRGNDRRYYRNNYRRCDNGTGGTVIGAIAGGLLGHEIVGRRGDRTAGALIGGVAGALAGRAIDRSDNPRRCR